MSLIVCFNWSSVFDIFILASLPNDINKFKTSLFSLINVLSITFDLRRLWLLSPSGIDENTVLKLSTRVSLNLSNYFLKPFSFISNFVYSSFYFFDYSLKAASVLSLSAIIPLSLVCSSFDLVRSACRISPIFSNLFFSLTYLLS